MPKHPSERYQLFRGAIHDRHDDGKISDAERDHIIEFLDAHDPDRRDPSKEKHRAVDEKTQSTLAAYAKRIRLVAQRHENDLTETDSDALNRMFADWLRGAHPAVKDEGLSKNTVKGTQGTIRRFYRFHEDLGVDDGEIDMTTAEKTPIDPRDIFNKEDIEDLRNAANHSRERAIIEFAISTGQRIRVLQMLKIRDLELNEGRFHIPDAEGLKGATGVRPLLGSEGPIREWLNGYHPCPDDPDAAVFTAYSPQQREHHGDHMSREMFYETFKAVGERAGVDKPTNPHNFRHSAATIMKVDYELDESYIKKILGHAPDSNVFESTYQHIADEDAAKAAEIAAGVRDPEPEESPLTPPTCPTCQEPLSDEARACPKCGTLFGPDAKAAQERVDDSVYQAKGQAEDEAEEEAVDALRDVLKDDPELARKIMDENPSLAGELLDG